MTKANSCETQETYYVEGMHCPGCELRIEKRLSKLSGVQTVDANARTGEVQIRRQGARLNAAKLTEIFSEDGYIFADQAYGRQPRRNLWVVAVVSLAFIGAFALVGRSGLSSIVQVDARSTLPAFFAFGLLAGASSCAALVGGLVLSMSRQWQTDYAGSDSWLGRAQPHVLFNAGRLIGFTLLGAILGSIGARLKLSVTVSALLVIVVSAWMLVLGLQMLGVKSLQGVQFRLPKAVTRFAADESNFRGGRYMPALLGALTFILPCGFTLTAQSLALISGNPLQGGLIMLFFALGTLPMLLGIGLSSTRLLAKRSTASYFMPVAGVLIIFFAVYNLNSQVNVLGWTSLSDLTLPSPQPAAASASATNGPTLPTVADGKQVLQMDASAYGYSPRWFRVKAGTPVRWKINDTGTSGCTNAIISRRLFPDAIPLTPGQVSVKEFTPQQPGVYKFSCWMGMVWGVIEVVS